MVCADTRVRPNVVAILQKERNIKSDDMPGTENYPCYLAQFVYFYCVAKEMCLILLSLKSTFCETL